jgi:hypothetical protein
MSQQQSLYQPESYAVSWTNREIERRADMHGRTVDK